MIKKRKIVPIERCYRYLQEIPQQKIIKNTWIYISLLAASALFLIIKQVTHIEFMLHVAAIPLEILLGALLIEKFLERKEKAEKLRQLMFFKGYMFQSEMRNLFITNFDALKSPEITMSKIKNASLEELKQMRRDADHIEYESLESMELVIKEYVLTYSVFNNFMERAITYNLETSFQDMLYILHFIQSVKLFKQTYPEKLFIYEAVKQPLLIKKVRKILENGIQHFLDYMIELKEKKPDLFYEIMSDYELSLQISFF